MREVDITNSFIVENKILAKEEFLLLDKLLSRFNVFEATDMNRQEIKHTKFLSYLLDANESHGFGEFFIKNFVTRISEKFEAFPKILDLDFSFSDVKPEFRDFVYSGGKKISLDILIKIPLRNSFKKNQVILAIENKIGSKQGATQLEDYSKAIDETFNANGNKLFKAYLTFNDEEANDPWVSITYGNVVLPSVYATIDVLEEKGSHHLKETLRNYYDLLMEDEEGELEKEILANQLIQDNEIKSFIEMRRQKGDRRSAFGDIYIKHKKVINYLCQFDGDVRSKTLKWWKCLEKQPSGVVIVNKNGNNLFLVYETSVRSYLRFSILSEKNRANLIKLSHPTRRWLVSGCPIAFEIIMSEVNSDNDEKQLIKCWATLALGPVKDDEVRLDLMRAIYPALQKNSEKRAFKDEICNDLWNRLITNKGGEWTDGASKNTTDPQAWIKTHVLNFDEQSLQEWIKDLSCRLDDALEAYFDLAPLFPDT